MILHLCDCCGKSVSESEGIHVKSTLLGNDFFVCPDCVESFQEKDKELSERLSREIHEAVKKAFDEFCEVIAAATAQKVAEALAEGKPVTFPFENILLHNWQKTGTTVSTALNDDILDKVKKITERSIQFGPLNNKYAPNGHMGYKSEPLTPAPWSL